MYYLGQIPGCIFWGWYADRRGRKEAMIIILICKGCIPRSSVGNIVCITGFGLSSNYYLSLVIRFIHGLTDGSLGVTKIILAEISNDRNISLGSSFFFVSVAVGRLLGPLLARVCTDEKITRALNQILPILGDRPFLLPFLLTAFCFIITLVSFVFFSVDTISEEEIQTAHEYQAQMKRDLSGIFRKNPLDGYDSHEQLLLQYHKYSKVSSILKDRDILLAVCIYFINSFVQMVFDAVFPSILVNKRQFGGFEMALSDVSTLQMMASPISIATGTSFAAGVTRSAAEPGMESAVDVSEAEQRVHGSHHGVHDAVPAAVAGEPQRGRGAVLRGVRGVRRVPADSLRVVHVEMGGGVEGRICTVLLANVSYKEFRGSIVGVAQTIGGVGRFIVGVERGGDA